jgi:hypothetical protein
MIRSNMHILVLLRIQFNWWLMTIPSHLYIHTITHNQQPIKKPLKLDPDKENKQTHSLILSNLIAHSLCNVHSLTPGLGLGLLISMDPLDIPNSIYPYKVSASSYSNKYCSPGATSTKKMHHEKCGIAKDQLTSSYALRGKSLRLARDSTTK